VNRRNDVQDAHAVGCLQLIAGRPPCSVSSVNGGTDSQMRERPFEMAANQLVFELSYFMVSAIFVVAWRLVAQQRCCMSL
jgi:hypothetical protein